MLIKINYENNLGLLDTDTNKVIFNNLYFDTILHAIEYIKKLEQERNVINIFLNDWHSH
jgi:ABC-type lipoprotein release transport system permease subunit